MFDTLKFARALRDGGQFTPEQAERLSDALSDAISSETVSKADQGATETELGRKIDESRADLAAVEAKLDRKIDDLGGELAAVEARLDRRIDDLRADLAAVEAKLDRRIDDLRADLKVEIRGMEAKFHAGTADTIKWVVGIIGFQTVAIIGAAVVLARLLR